MGPVQDFTCKSKETEIVWKDYVALLNSRVCSGFLFVRKTKQTFGNDVFRFYVNS